MLPQLLATVCWVSHVGSFSAVELMVCYLLFSPSSPVPIILKKNKIKSEIPSLSCVDGVKLCTLAIFGVLKLNSTDDKLEHLSYSLKSMPFFG
jgi:hypothetical protein